MKYIATGIFTALFSMSNAGAAIINGDFEAANTGFTSEYSFATTNTTEGEYTVRPDPQNWNPSFSAIPDHTSGTGNMLVVNGAPTSDKVVWEQTITVDAGTDYAFSAWVSTAVAGGPADLIMVVNGVTLGSSFLAPADPGSWDNMVRSWNSGSDTTATLQLFDINVSVFPNDFYIDDISFNKVSAVPVPAAIWLMGSGLVALFSFQKRKRQA